jgi:hypothetical protein
VNNRNGISSVKTQDAMPSLRPQNLDQLDFEWLLLTGVREMLSLANEETVTYVRSAAVLKEVAAQLIEDNSPLIESIESDLQRLYRERASLRSSAEGRMVQPSIVLDEDIGRIQQEISSSSVGDDTSETESYLRRLQRARATIDESDWTEHQVIRRDSETHRRILPISGQGQDYREFDAGRDRVLRVRVLHPDRAEWESGVDLVYEDYAYSGAPTLDLNSEQTDSFLMLLPACQTKLELPHYNTRCGREG